MNTTTSKFKHEIWRYFLSYLLTPDLNSLISIVIILFFFVSMFERFLGNACVAILFFSSNILVNFFIGSFYEGSYYSKIIIYS